MELTTSHLKAISTLLDTSDRAAVAAQTGTSPNTVKAVLGGRRRTQKIEEALVLFARDKITELDKLITDIETNNILPISVQDYNTYRNGTAFSHGRFHARYLDVYLELCHLELGDMENNWGIISDKYKDIIPQRVYCIALLVRLIGVSDIEAVTFYNKKAVFDC